MNRLKKISIISAVGGTFIGKYLWLDQSNVAWAATNTTQEQRASVVPVITNLLLTENADFNNVPATQTIDEDALLDFAASNNNLISVTSIDIVSCAVSVNNGVLTILANSGLITQGALNTNSFTISGTQQQINDALATLTYQPNTDFNGIDLLTIVTTSSNGGSDTDNVQIIVTPTDDGAPVAEEDNFSTLFNAQLVGNVLSNDTLIDEADVDPINNASTSQGGTINISADGQFTYTPPNGFANTDTFVYTLRDADEQTDTATINIEPITFDLIIPDNNGAEVLGNESVIEGQTFFNGSFTIVSSVGLGITTALSIRHESGDSLDLSLTQLARLATENQPLGTMDGELVLTDYDPSTGVVNYQYNAVVSDHFSGDFSIDDSFTITAVNVSPSVTSAMLNFLITDTNPIANDDNRTIFEGTSAIAGNAVGFLGSAFGDNTDTIIDQNSTPVTGLDFGATNGIVGVSLAAELGTMVISNTGIYTYTLDNTNPTVQGLKASEMAFEVFTYTITDGDNDTDTATISVTVNGIEDAAPTITIPNGNGSSAGDQSVAEASTFTANGTITVNASAGIDELSIDNQDVTNSTANNITINASEGTLAVTSFDASTGVISYSFTENGSAADHSAGDNSVVDSFTISVVDNEGDSATDTLDILILDTAPTAASDNNSITEDGFVVTGDVLINDTSGADTAISVFAVDFDGVSRTVGQPFDTDFGTLDLNSDGTYTYTLDNTNPAVQALNSGESAEEVFTYTAADTDGDLSSTGLFITINGTNE